MSLNLSLFLILSLFFISAISAETFNGDDSLIRQVVEGQDESSSNLLTAEQHHFSLFKRKFKKSYLSQEEHDYRFSVFKSNLRRAARHQKLDPTASHGVTQFSDLTSAEFRKQVLGLRKLRLPKDANTAPILPTNDLPEDFDWREKGAVGPVKNQVFYDLIFFCLMIVCLWEVAFFCFFLVGSDLCYAIHGLVWKFLSEYSIIFVYIFSDFRRGSYVLAFIIFLKLQP
jgi:hypothetical protein